MLTVVIWSYYYMLPKTRKYSNALGFMILSSFNFPLNAVDNTEAKNMTENT